MRHLLILLLALWPLAATAQVFPPPLSDTISDFARALPPEAAARLSQALRAARDETGVHVAVAVIDRRADYGDTGRLDAFAKGLFNAWGIGDPVKNNGILVLYALGDREVRIALGVGYDPVWDGAALRVIDRTILPAMRAGRTAEAIEGGAMATLASIARPHAAGAAPDPDPQGALSGIVQAVIAAAGGLIVLVLAVNARRRRRALAAGAMGAVLGENPGSAQAATRQDSGSGGGFDGGSSDGGGASGNW